MLQAELSLASPTITGYKELVPPVFYWPVLRCPSLAGFDLSPEALSLPDKPVFTIEDAIRAVEAYERSKTVGS